MWSERDVWMYVLVDGWYHTTSDMSEIRIGNREYRVYSKYTNTNTSVIIIHQCLVFIWSWTYQSLYCSLVWFRSLIDFIDSNEAEVELLWLWKGVSEWVCVWQGRGHSSIPVYLPRTQKSNQTRRPTRTRREWKYGSKYQENKENTANKKRNEKN